MGGFTAPLVAERASLQRLVFVNAMIPVPGETAGAWWDNTGAPAAREEAAQARGYPVEFDLAVYFLHDLAPDIVTALAGHHRDEAAIAFGEPCSFREWPDIPIHAIAGKDERFFPEDFQRRIVRDRLDIGVDVVPGGHLLPLSHPEALVDRLLGYL